MEKQFLFNEGIEETGKASVAIQNILIVGQIAAGTWLLSSFAVFKIPFLSIFYGLFAVFMLGFFLRKHLCTSCYYHGKWCHCGWGKLSALWFKKDGGNYLLGGKWAGITWPVLMLLPIAMFGISLVMKKTSSISELSVLLIFVVIGGVNMGLHFVDCRRCKMRFICPGSAAKREV